jgi:di/tripeptidase
VGNEGNTLVTEGFITFRYSLNWVGNEGNTLVTEGFITSRYSLNWVGNEGNTLVTEGFITFRYSLNWVGNEGNTLVTEGFVTARYSVNCQVVVSHCNMKVSGVHHLQVQGSGTRWCGARAENRSASYSSPSVTGSRTR